MLEYRHVEETIQSILDKYIQTISKEVTIKAANGSPEWELRHLSGKPVGAATFASILVTELKKWEEENDA